LNIKVFDWNLLDKSVRNELVFYYFILNPIIHLEMLNDRSTVHEFINLSKLLAFPGELTENTSIGK